jgi:hypothetical protein
MTKLERQLAETFLAARWAESHGRPVCPSCYDGQAVEADEQARSGRRGLSTYLCRDCITRFSDTSGTVLAGSQRPLRDWAIALLVPIGQRDWELVRDLMPTPTIPAAHRPSRDWVYYVAKKAGVLPPALRQLCARWDEGSRLGPLWVQTLDQAGVDLRGLIGCGRAGAPPLRKERTC